METVRTILIKLTENDFEFYFRLYGNENVMRYISGKGLTLPEAQQRFGEIIDININNKETGYFKIILKNTKVPVGVSKIVMNNPEEAEIGYVISPDFWGKRFGSEISEELVRYSRNLKGLKSLVAITDPHNLASKKILVKCGFSLEEYVMMDGLPGENYRLIL